MGTVDYVAPEQVEGKPIDFRTDVYSLGCVAYQCLTGRLPYPKESDLAVLWAHVHEKPPRATEHRTELPPGVDSVLARAMAKEPKDRYESCGDFALALEDRLGAAPPAVRPKPSGRRVLRPSPRALRIISVAAVVVLGAVLAGIMLTRGSSAQGCPHFRGTRKRLERIDPKLVAAVQFASAPSLSEKVAVDQKGVVWVTTPAGVDAVCSGRGQTGGIVHLSFAPKDLAVGENGVWVVGAPRGQSGDSRSAGRIVRVIDPSGKLGQFRTLQDEPDHVALGLAGGGAVWILSHRGTLTRLARPAVGSSVHVPQQQTRSVRVGVGASDVVVGDTGVWVVNDAARTIVRVDTDTLKVGNRESLPGGGGDAVASTAGKVWSLDTAHRTLVPLDDDSGRPNGAPVRVGRVPLDVVSADGYLWVANGWSVWRIDPETREVRKAPVDGRVLALAAQPPSLSRKQAIWVLVRQRT
jgi:sugar lactone lactonase YvrE